MSRWSPTRSPHQPGANYFSSGVQPGPRPGTFCSHFFFPHYHYFYFRVLPKCQFTLIWQGRQMLGAVACVQSDKDLMGGRVWPHNLRRFFFTQGKMTVMIATHGRNFRGSSNAVLNLEAVIYTSLSLSVPLWNWIICFARLVKQTFVHRSGIFFSSDYLKSILRLHDNMQRSLSCQYYLKQRELHKISVCKGLSLWKCERNTHLPLLWHLPI